MATTLMPPVDERREYARGDAWRPGHAVADDGNDGHARPRGHVVDQPRIQFVTERRAQAGDGPVRFALGHGEPDRALGRRLEDRRDGETFCVDCDECPCRYAVDADHALPGDGHDRLAAHDRDRLDRIGRERALRGDFGTRLLRVDERPHVQRDARSGDRDERARVQYLRSVVRDFRRLAVMQLRDEPGVRHEPGIGGQDSGDILPQRHARRAERAGHERGCQIGSAAAERRDAAVGRMADEARYHGDGARIEQRLDPSPRQARRSGNMRRRAAVLSVGDDDFRGLDIRRSPPSPHERRRDNLRRHALTARHQEVAGARREVPEHADRNAQLAEFARGGIDRGQKTASRRPGGNQPSCDVPVAAEEGRSGSGGFGLSPGRGCVGSLEQQIRDASERGGDNDERPMMPRDELDGAFDGRNVGE